MSKTIDPRMHSAEHILNQTMDGLFHCGRCFSAHIEKKKSKCDYRFDRELSQSEVAEIQTRVNDVIQQNMPVSEKLITRAEAERDYNTEKLPADSGNRIRIINIGNYDACPCVGPHVKSTLEIGTFRITTTSFEDGVLRIRYKLSPPK
jgi:Ser-tRNA(Ala) deacylase AlaX